MAVYSVALDRAKSASDQSFQWHLDLPAIRTDIDGNKLKRDGMFFQGWILARHNKKFSLVILHGDNVTQLPLTRERPDVIQKVLNDEPESHPALICGFSKTVKLSSSTFSIAVIADGRFHELLKGSIHGKFQILKGTDHWLFLDNDSNRSVEQFTGKVKLSRTARSEWKAYLSFVTSYSEQSGIPICLLIAPSKEMVCSEYYPYLESSKAPIYSLIRLIPDSLKFVFPVHELKSLEQRSFRVCDTHWTLHGARCASQMVANELSGRSLSHFDVFGADRYQRRKQAGDLGSKLFPSQTHDEDYLFTFSYKKTVVFDNNVDNFGRIIVMYNSDAVIDQSLLIFGSSSSYTMFHYICRLYTSVVFVHTAGNIDHDIIEKVRPDSICLQTNARFVVKAPKFSDSVLAYIEKKRQSGNLKTAEIANALPSACRHYIEYFSSLK